MLNICPLLAKQSPAKHSFIAFMGHRFPTSAISEQCNDRRSCEETRKKSELHTMSLPAWKNKLLAVLWASIMWERGTDMTNCILFLFSNRFVLRMRSQGKRSLKAIFQRQKKRIWLLAQIQPLLFPLQYKLLHACLCKLISNVQPSNCKLRLLHANTTAWICIGCYP